MANVSERQFVSIPCGCGCSTETHLRLAQRNRHVLGRTLRLTPEGNREAFLQALDRIYRIPGGGCS